jgi:phosphate transport system substrate-binding protein
MEFDSVNTFSTRRRVVTAILAGTLLVAACGDDDDDTGGATTGGGAATTAAPATTGGGAATTAAPATTGGGADTAAPGTTGGGGGDVSGSIAVSGSSTVEPISNAIGSAFSDANPDVAITVEGPGTGDGFAQFCAGELDVADASRPISEEEIATCEENGVEFVELKIALDGLSVITSAQNTDVDCLSFPDLYALLGPDATGRNNWSDATEQADEIGSTVTDLGTPNTPFPDADLTITAPGEESGTYDAFVELALLPVGEALGVEEDAVVARPDYTASPNDNVIVEGIGGDPTSLGWVGFAFVEENLDTIRPISIDGGGGCVEPTPETIASGEYPIARDLFIYVSVPAAEENPAVAPFVDYYLSDDGLGTVIGTDVDAGQVPYVPLAPEDLEATRAAWADMTTGTQQGG